MEKIANRTHEIYALGYYHGRVHGQSETPSLRRSVDLLEDFYRLGYARGLRDHYAESPVTQRVDLDQHKEDTE